MSELGPLQGFFDDPEVEEVRVNEPGEVFVARRGRGAPTGTVLPAAAVTELVERMRLPPGPFADVSLPDGSWLRVVRPGVTRDHPTLHVRRFTARPSGVDDLVRLGLLPPAPARFLAAAVGSGLTMLVSGGPAAGKTTVLNGLLGALPAGRRLVTVEEVFELRPPVPDRVALRARPGVPAGRLLREALRMRPDRVAIGELRSVDGPDLLLALDSGVPLLGTLTAGSAAEAVRAVGTLALVGGPDVPAAVALATVADRLALVAHVGPDRSGTRRIREILAVAGTAVLYGTAADRLVRAYGHPPWTDRFARHGHDLASLLDCPQ
jgi:pilus assembly protein CpaF